MIPLWMFPMAIATGNTMLLKPSEKDPGATMMIAQMAQDAGIPDGCLNIIHGSTDCACTEYGTHCTLPHAQDV
jgi:malonate-semialdehyde dehydrogenase (acetylating)/methylmalonate-semialdehyde dehydrogenase